MEEREDDEQMLENGTHEPSPVENGDPVEEKFRTLTKNDEAEFDAWTSLISEIEKPSSSDMESIRQVYDAFLLEFPLCYGYWKKYANHMAYHCNLNEVEKVYERAIEAIPYSVDLWVNYCSFGVLAYEDPADVRRLFERGLSFLSKDYSSHLLWDKYIEFEYSQKQWTRLAYVYISTLRFPTKKLNSYYTSFKKFVAIWEEEILCQKNTKAETGPNCEKTGGKGCEHTEIMNVIRNLMDLKDSLPNPSIVKKYLSVGELLYHGSSKIDEKINSYEASIHRSYFHVKPLDEYQLENWHQYLDFVEMQGDFDWTVKLYERCLIPCANYSEFWIRYVEFVEAKGGREIANHALGRAQKVFFKTVPAFHLYCSMFKEKTGDVNGARAHFPRRDIELDPEFIEDVTREANMERRTGNTESAYMVFEKAIEMAKENQNLQTLSILYVKFARFTFVVSNDIDAAIEVFMRGIQELPCKSIIQEMINFITLCAVPGKIPKVASNIANIIDPESAVSPALNSHDREEISNLFLEFVDLYGTIHEIRHAWDHHRRLFPHIMKPIGNCHCTPVRDNPLIKEVVGRKQPFVPGSHQACGINDHDDSRMHLLDCQSPEHNDHTPSEARVTGELQDGLNDKKGREELVEVGEDVVNGNKGREELLEVAEVVEKQSISDSKGTEELLEVAKDVEMQSIPEGTELHKEARVSGQECQVAAQVPEATPEYPNVENQVQSCLEQEPGDDLRPPSPENLSITYQDNETQRCEPTDSCDHNIAQEATSGGENVLLDEGNSDEVSAIHVSDPIDVKPSTPSQVQGNNSPLHSVCDSTPPESRSNPQVEMQVHSQAPMLQALPVSVAYSQNATSAGNWPQMYYVQSSQSQQWHIQPQLTPAGTTNTQMVVAQGYPYQSQAWTGTLDQKVNEAFGQYQMATTHVYPIGNLSWPGQNVQQQAYAYGQSQSGTQPQTQTQVNQQSAQNNEQQFGYLQNSQGIPPHIWQYYQQQYYYLQQQQQLQSQQLQYNSQQEQKIDQQMNPQQQQLQLNQQISSQQQQPQQNEQSIQQLQQHQLAQYQQHNQQVHNAQQYQQLLYMQQQQQQQLYLQQQQQCYQQQQQLLQQQEFQQLSQQEQQLLLQQQQQLLLQQQQQQFLQLQQQQQQQLQQLQQQSIQQQQLQQQPVVQQQQPQVQPVMQQQQQPQVQPVMQQQQQISASDLKALNRNYIQQSLHGQQHSSNQDRSEYDEQPITSEGGSDKLQNAEQSRRSISPRSHSPPNQ